MTRSSIGEALDEFYLARQQDDLERCLKCFAPGASVVLAGSQEHSAFPSRVDTSDQLRSLVSTIIENWRWVHREECHRVIDEKGAAVLYALDGVHVPSSEPFNTQIMDFFVFNDDAKVAELTQFVDTAFVQSMVDAGESLAR